MKTKIMKLSGKPVISREHIVKMGDSLFNNDEVDSVKLEIIFKDKSKLSYDSGTKRKALFDAEMDEMMEDDKDD